MDRELEVLKGIVEDNSVSQRALAKTIGCSLGAINGTIQELYNNRYVELTEMSAKRVKYTLTEEGKKLYAKKLYGEMVEAYDVIAEVKNNVKAIIVALYDEGYYHFLLDGKVDEAYRLVKMTLIELKRDRGLSYGDYIGDGNAESCVLYWDTDKGYAENVKAINIFMN